LPKFDAGFTSYYSLSQPGPDRIIAARGDYNSLHVDQLLWLYDQTGDSWFLEWASRFQAYEVNGYKYSAKGSVDPARHGPDQAAALYGSRYWSHADFPTWIEVGMPKRHSVSGFWVDGNGEKATPKDFSVDAFVDGEWQIMRRIEGNTKKRQVVQFDEPVVTDRLRLNIFQDNGNRNTALQAAVPILTNPQYAAIANSCNYRIRGNFDYNVNAVEDGDPKTSMNVLCPGWVIVPNPERLQLLSVQYSGELGASMTVEYSMTMDNWKSLGKFTADQLDGLYVPSGLFVKLTFNKDVKSIREVEFK